MRDHYEPGIIINLHNSIVRASNYLEKQVYCTHVTSEKSGAQRGGVGCPGSHCYYLSTWIRTVFSDFNSIALFAAP